MLPIEIIREILYYYNVALRDETMIVNMHKELKNATFCVYHTIDCAERGTPEKIFYSKRAIIGHRINGKWYRNWHLMHKDSRMCMECFAGEMTN